MDRNIQHRYETRSRSRSQKREVKRKYEDTDDEDWGNLLAATDCRKFAKTNAESGEKMKVKSKLKRKIVPIRGCRTGTGLSITKEEEGENASGQESHEKVKSTSTSAFHDKKPQIKKKGAPAPTEDNIGRVSQPTPMPAPDKSKSSDYRAKGNEYYKGFIISTNFQDQKKHLQTAIQFYRQAYDAAADYTEYCKTNNFNRTSNSEQDASSAAKNCGTAAWKLLTVLNEINAHPETIERQYREAIEFFSKALATAKTCQTSEWIADIKKRYIECTESALTTLEDLPVGYRTRAIENHIQAMTENSQKSKFFLEIANLTFRIGVVSLGSRDFKAALHAFHDCYRPVQECKRFVHEREILQVSDGVDFATEARIMEDDLVFHLAAAESLQAISIGDQLRKSSIQDHETLNMDIVYEVIDWYKKAIVSTREINVEVEAIALSRLGCLYDEVLKIKYKAKEYFLRCMQLGVSLFPKNTNKELWFVKCMKALQRYQEESTKNDDAAQQEDRKKYIDELKVELKKLEGANSGNRPSIDLLRFVYKTFPPKDPKHKLDDGEELIGGRIKKLLLKAILHYHPDKQDIKKYGKKWQVLCGEITKAFTNRYEGCKLDPSE